VYTIVMKKHLPSEESANIPLFFGYIGLFVSLALCPAVAILVASGGFNMASIPKQVYMLIMLEGGPRRVLSPARRAWGAPLQAGARSLPPSPGSGWALPGLFHAPWVAAGQLPGRASRASGRQLRARRAAWAR
jgi:hypothetical protein